MNPLDSLVTDSLATGVQTVAQADSGGIALSGIIVVFMGLVLIALTIYLFNRVFAKLVENKTTSDGPVEQKVEEVRTKPGKKIPEDHLVAISLAVELYQRLHLDQPESRVTFIRGEGHSEWKSGSKYGQRQSLR